MTEKDRLLTAQEVADRYRLRLQWVYGCRSLPRRKVGRYLRFLESELETWEKRQTGSGRVYGFHITDNTEVRTKPKVFHRPMSDKTRYGKDWHFELLFDCQ